jgi:hypothetical protein
MHLALAGGLLACAYFHDGNNEQQKFVLLLSEKKADRRDDVVNIMENIYTYRVCI